MRTDNHQAPHRGLRRYLRFGAVFLASLAISASAQAPKVLPSPPVHAKKAGRPRKATLRELYELFFTFATHVEARAEADTKRGRDMTFYRAHLQKASGLDAVEYARVLDAAQRFAAVDADVQKQLSELMKDAKSGQSGTTAARLILPSGYRTQISSLQTQKVESLTNEIATVRRVLGEERANMFETYLQTKYIMGRVGPALPEKNSSIRTQEKSKAKPDDVPIDGGNTCQDFDLDDGGTWSICADAQISYVNTDVAEFIAQMLANWNDPNGATVVSYGVEGDFFVDGENILDCGSDTDGELSHNCDITLSYGDGVSYDWNSTGTALLYYDDECDGYCDQDQEDYTSDDASVTIYYPDINTLSKDSFAQRSSGTFTIDGLYLESPFENAPTVTVADQGSIFSSFDVTPPDSYPDGDITINYVVQDNAPPGTYTLNVNNGFGSDPDGYDITIPVPPAINGIAVNGVANAPLMANTTQTVTLTGTNFGSSSPTITVASDGTYVTAGAVTSYTDESVSFPVTTTLLAPNGMASFALAGANGNATSPSVAVDQIALLAPQIMMVTNPANLQSCTGGTEIDTGVIATNIAYAGQLWMLCSPTPNLPAGVTLTSWTWSPQNLLDLNGGYCAPLPPNVFPVPGAAVQPCPTPAAGQPLAAPVMSGVTTAGISTGIPFYWINPNITEAMTYQYCINNSTAVCASATAAFSISGPTPAINAFLNTTTTSTTVSGPPYLAFGEFDAQGDFVVPGITFYNDTAMPANTGTLQWVQVLNTSYFLNLGSPSGAYPSGIALCQSPTRQSPKNPSGDPQGTPELDNTYPYRMFFPQTQNSPASTADAPAVTLGTAGEVERVFSATMYLMWDPTMNLDGTSCVAAFFNPGDPNPTPSDCTGSIPVPLASVTWKWAACAVDTQNTQLGINGWNFQQAGCSTSTPDAIVTVPATSYPQWTQQTLNGPGNVACYPYPQP
jgi:hypothetical protein